MRRLFGLVCAALLAATVGCDGGDGGDGAGGAGGTTGVGGTGGDGGGGGPVHPIADGPLSGQIGGQPWTVVSAWTDPFLSDEKGLFTTLYDTQAEACGATPDTERVVLLNAPPTAGTYELGLALNVTMAVGSDNKVATKGSMVVEKVTDTELTVGFYAIFDDDPTFELDGHFTATICPPE